MKTLLSIDLSTNCTGWSLFQIDTCSLIEYGSIKGKSFKDTSQWRSTLKKLEYMASSILNLIEQYKPDLIVIEEIAGSKNRIGQKTLDMAHGILWKTIDKYLDIVSYYDVSGSDGWRTHLGLKLTEADKLANREAKKLNPQLGRGVSKMPVYTPKDLAARYANWRFGLALDVQLNQTDNDIADSISMGSAFISFRMSK
jgi:Holliday junction resolvasome RuvABC endonuclease subunit